MNIKKLAFITLNALAASCNRNLLLIGGATELCSSAALANCDSPLVDFQAIAEEQGKGDVQIKEEDLYQVTEQTIQGLLTLEWYPLWAIQDLKQLDSDTQYTYDGFKDAISSIDEYFISDLDDAEWSATLGYLSVVQHEVVSFSHSPVYSQALFTQFVSMSGGASSVIGIVSSSSGDDADSYLFYEQAFWQAGAGEVMWVPVDLAYRKGLEEGNCDDLEEYVADTYGEYDTDRRYPEVATLRLSGCQDPSTVYSNLERLTGIFFTGGDQQKHKDSLIDASSSDFPEMEIIRRRVDSGELALSGTSAGTAVQSGSSLRNSIPMIAGGESYYALLNEPRTAACYLSSCEEDLVYDPAGGLRLFPYGVLDTHFSQRGRAGRLVRLAALVDVDLAFGIDETTGLWVRELGEETEFEVMGEYGVNLFNMKEAILKDGSGDFQAKNVKWSYFTTGDKFTIHSDGSISATVASYKSAIEEQRGSPKSSTDVFSSPDRPTGRANYMEFVVLAESLVDSGSKGSTTGESYETSPIYQVVYEKSKGTEAYKGCSDQGDERYAIIDMNITMKPKFSIKRWLQSICPIF